MNCKERDAASMDVPMHTGIAMARLRTSSHSLAIEVGRFHKPRPLLETDRLCTVCDIIEDEYHFLCVRVSTIFIKEVTIGNDGRKSLPLLYHFMSQELKFYSAIPTHK